jgi:hypothetical protein
VVVIFGSLAACARGTALLRRSQDEPQAEQPEQQLSARMREAMALWLENSDNEKLKARFRALQARYQRMFLAYKEGQTDRLA